jgi:hypothetical protein
MSLHQSLDLPEAAVGGESERIRLVLAARAAALLVPGVLGADAGPLGTFVTEASDGERLMGVVCVAAPGGGYDVSLRLVCGLVALHPLGDAVRAAVMRAARIDRIELGSVSVHFADLADGLG